MVMALSQKSSLAVSSLRLNSRGAANRIAAAARL